MARLNYNHLRYFWAVAHNGNLTRTAEQLHVSQSALSLQIRKLEEQLGHDLFERRGKQLVLTEAGRLALDHADVIFAAGDELLSTLQHAGHTRDMLRVGALSTLSRNFQTRFLEPHFGRDDIGMVVRSGRLADLLAQLEAHHLDVVLTNEVPPRDAATPWIVQLLDEQPVELVGPPGQGLEQRSLPDLLTTENLIVPTVETSIRTAFDALVHRLGVVPNLAAEVDDMALIRLLARNGEGLAVIPPIVARDELASGLLIEVAELPGITESFHAITLARKFPHPLIGELLAGFE